MSTEPNQTANEVVPNRPPGLRIQHRKRVLVNTDPLRRCYWGAHAKCEWQWTNWGDLESMCYLRPGADPKKRLRFWQELNDYAVSCRGESARTQFRLVNEKDEVVELE